MMAQHCPRAILSIYQYYRYLILYKPCDCAISSIKKHQIETESFTKFLNSQSDFNQVCQA